MRKYSRLLLILIALIACVLMFVYRQKYSNLSSLFQIMSTFQVADSNAACDKKILEIKNSLISNSIFKQWTSGIPYWTEMFPGVYIYSSRWLNNMVRSLVYAKNVPRTELLKIDCELWYENSKHRSQPVLKTYLILRKSHSSLLFFECIPSHNEVPHSITFKLENVSATYSLPVLHQNSYASPYTLCIKPLPPSFGNIYKIMEFIIYHSHIGINHFVFYERGLSISLRKFMSEVASQAGIYLQLLPWNIPFVAEESLTSEALFIDCMHYAASRNHSDTFLVLGLDDFIILGENQELNVLGNSFNFFVGISALQVKRFCTEYPNDLIAHHLNMSFITLLKTKVAYKHLSISQVAYSVSKFQKIMNSEELRMWFVRKKLQKSIVIPLEHAVLHSYSECGPMFIREKVFSEDRYMWKFKNLFYNSFTYKLSKKYGLISN